MLALKEKLLCFFFNIKVCLQVLVRTSGKKVERIFVAV